jgi:hypothetical protein
MNGLLLAQNAGDVGGFFVGFSILWVFMFLLGIAALVVWVWALIDAIQNRRSLARSSTWPWDGPGDHPVEYKVVVSGQCDVCDARQLRQFNL